MKRTKRNVAMLFMLPLGIASVLARSIHPDGLQGVLSIRSQGQRSQ